MPSEILWLLEDQVILIKYIGKVTKEDVIYSTTVGEEWLRGTKSKIYVINDMSKTESLVPSFHKVGDILNVTRSFMQMENLGTTTAFGINNAMIKFMSSVVLQVSGIDFRIFDTYSACRNYLVHKIPALDNLPASID